MFVFLIFLLRYGRLVRWYNFTLFPSDGLYGSKCFAHPQIGPCVSQKEHASGSPPGHGENGLPRWPLRGSPLFDHFAEGIASLMRNSLRPWARRSILPLCAVALILTPATQ